MGGLILGFLSDKGSNHKLKKIKAEIPKNRKIWEKIENCVFLTYNHPMLTFRKEIIYILP